MIMVLCLLVYALAEWRLRTRLRETGRTVKNQLKKPVQNPTLKWIFTIFMGPVCRNYYFVRETCEMYVFAVIIGFIVLIVILTFIQTLLQIPAWVVSLDIQKPIKMWIIDNTFAIFLYLVGIPVLIITKIRRIW